MEEENRELASKIDEESQEIEARSNELRRLESENEKAARIIGELEKEMQLGESEFAKLQVLAENERRETLMNE